MAEELVSEDDGLLGDDHPDEEGQVEEDGEEEGGGEAPEPDPEPPEKPKGRLAARREALRAREEEAAAERQRAQRAEDELARIRGEQTRQEQERARQQALAEENDEKIPYEQRLYKYTARTTKEMQDRQSALEARLLDQTDRSEFNARASVDPRVAKYKDRVEARLTQMRQNGQNAPREAIMKYLAGEDLFSEKTAKSSSKQKDEAAARVSKARGEPTNARSDARSGAGSGKSKLKDLEKRLTDVPL